jgi:caveolin 1
MTDKKTGSKTNLNESTLPLLDEGKGDTKEEKIELESKAEGEAEKTSDSKDKGEGECWFDASEEGAGGQSRRLMFVRRFFPGSGKKVAAKKEKVKKEKVVKERKPCVSPLTRAQNVTIGLNVLNRDEKEINRAVNIQFDDVLGETDNNQGFEFVWRLTFLIFQTVRLWAYRLLATVVALPLAIIWALVFAFINVLGVWGFTPLLRVYDVLLHYIYRVWSGLVRTTLDPLFTSAGLLLANIRTNSVQAQPTNVV